MHDVEAELAEGKRRLAKAREDHEGALKCLSPDLQQLELDLIHMENNRRLLPLVARLEAARSYSFSDSPIHVTTIPSQPKQPPVPLPPVARPLPPPLDDFPRPKPGRKRAFKRRRRWSEDEHKRFLEGVQKYGREWAMVTQCVGTRTVFQVRSHALAVTKNPATSHLIPPPRPYLCMNKTQ